eukprot:CAMPEP_0206166690 /NCGR_PEP_ID=MMETSP1474-20131121/25039_1 /ASSEMBLY_ACC=CAM_ASM_001110 /TAXON_ID=97495 /ORGANISM="Imantonia sp., Strain RCC918" /LENGTH=104 /DNA_ID=CAMNT_0053570869 /DNA_START=518 /DNA_END=830 /DNA_ORIENTATION=-
MLPAEDDGDATDRLAAFGLAAGAAAAASTIDRPRFVPAAGAPPDPDPAPSCATVRVPSWDTDRGMPNEAQRAENVASTSRARRAPAVLFDASGRWRLAAPPEPP